MTFYFRPQLQNLLNLVCSTAQPTNVTLRDACITCFSRVTAMPEVVSIKNVFLFIKKVFKKESINTSFNVETHII